MTTTIASRFVRPPQPRTNLLLQGRDRELLRLLHRYRYLRAEHVRELLLPGRARRVVQARLRKLWEHRFIDRYFLRYVLDGETKPPPDAGVPIYGVGELGQDLLRRDYDLHADRSKPSPNRIAHDLVVSDCLVALSAACRRELKIQLVTVEPEAMLWRHLAARGITPREAIIPDGAWTIRYADGRLLTFHLEVVRADLKGGNQRLVERMEEYATLNHQDFFRDAYGHERLRAVIFATTAQTRADNLRALVNQVAFGEHLFWFGVYTQSGNGRPQSVFSAETILTLPWRGIDGFYCLASPFEPSTHAPSHPSHPPAADPNGAPAHPRADDVPQAIPALRAPPD